MNGARLVRYDAMVNAIIACHSVDEVKDIHDKALALQLYARQAQNVEAERKACEVRLRAEKRAGELFAEKQRGDAGRPEKKAATAAAISSYQDALASSGVNERTARRWQELASVPKEVFESHLADPEVMPTTNRILRAANGNTKMDDGALWLWGRLRDFERDGLLARDPGEVFGCMTETMQADVRRAVRTVNAWLTTLEEST